MLDLICRFIETPGILERLLGMVDSPLPNNTRGWSALCGGFGGCF